ncbi:MAG TPA: acyltransferase [Halobacteria archaeon]|jgi:acetyltransferase-like isoleucine patch superfamily enzyme|nr:acyltransferase [Halobacteria archaeon]
MNIQERLLAIGQIVDAGVDTEGCTRILELIEAPLVSTEILEELKLYSEYLPKARELPFTPEQRYLHFIWDIFDKSPMSEAVNFAVPFRRILAKRLFKKCGKNFIAEENVRFNFGQNIEVGDDVFINRGVYLDAKGGIVIGNFVGLAEGAEIYTHNHSESDNTKKEYSRVVIKDFAMIAAHAMILPGVTVNEQAIVAAKALVTKDVEPNMVVAGIPAKVVRERRTNGKKREELNHIWFYDAAFQK